MAEEEKDSPELKVARLFRLAGYEVKQVVGDEPGVVDWFATPREGFVRPRTYWRAWHTCPQDLDAALAVLETARIAKHADRALGVILTGQLASRYATDLSAHATTAITCRRLALEMAGLVEQVRDHVQEYELSSGHTLFLPRRGRMGSTHINDVVSHIEKWSKSGAPGVLVLSGERYSGRHSVANEVRYRIGTSFLEDPEKVTPIVAPSTHPLFNTIARRRWVITLEERTSVAEGSDGGDESVERDFDSREQILLIRRERPAESRDDSITLLEPKAEEIEKWYSERIAHRRTYGRFLDAYRSCPPFAALVGALPNLAPIMAALEHVASQYDEGSTSEWTARVTAIYINKLVEMSGGPDQAGWFRVYEDASLELFALGQADSFEYLEYSSGFNSVAAQLTTWAQRMASREANPADGSVPAWPVFIVSDLHNQLVHHYFLASRIAREVRAGNLDILTRYQFPREYVLLFLAILAPDVAAQATADRGEAIRAQIETEVERRLQLTLAHALKRSAGAVRSHLKAIQRHVERTSPGALEHEFARIEEEAAFQCALAEQTRLWHEVPESEVIGLSLESSLASIVADLRAAHPGVAFESAVDPALRVRATQEVLREILHCLLENAFQAVAFAGDLQSPRVHVEARTEGGTVRLDVLDNGPGIAAGDRERIFDLYVTTKKGGENRPLGTGMGLPIARRYAEHVGGQVGLDPEREETCFFVRLVAWREIG